MRKPNGTVGRPGMTLIESLIVLIVIGVAMGVTAEAVDLSAVKADAAARAVAARLMEAQRRAVLAQHDVRVVFDAARSELRVHEDVDGDGSVDEVERRVVIALEEGVAIGRGSAPAARFGEDAVTFRESAEGPTLVFHRDGSASEWGGLYLTSRLRGRMAQWSIEVERSTGRSTLREHRGGEWREGV